MRHARDEDLVAITDVLASLRAIPELRERRPGVFYLRGKALVHFHEDAGDLFADVRPRDAAAFTRVRVRTPAERQHLVRAARDAARPAPR